MNNFNATAFFTQCVKTITQNINPYIVLAQQCMVYGPEQEYTKMMFCYSNDDDTDRYYITQTV